MIFTLIAVHTANENAGFALAVDPDTPPARILSLVLADTVLPTVNGTARALDLVTAHAGLQEPPSHAAPGERLRFGSVIGGHSPAMEPSLNLEAPATPRAVPKIRAAVRRFISEHCDADDELALDIALAVTEASANVVRHAYRAEPGPLIVSAAVEADTVLVRVIDQGVGLFEPTTDPGLGLGLRILRTTTQDLTIDSTPGAGTTVHLRFPCHTPQTRTTTPSSSDSSRPPTG